MAEEAPVIPPVVDAIPPVNAISLKLPVFWTDRPAVWFAQAEAQFLVKRITCDATKHAHVISSLGNEAAAEVESDILHPPNDDKYEKLKSSLIAAFGQSQTAKDNALLNLSGLGDRKPTSLLRYMQSLNSDPATLFKACFLQQLPVDVRRILAASNKSVEDLAKDADCIIESAGTRYSSVATLQNPTVPPRERGPIKNPSLCYYHARFGIKARACKGDGCRMAGQPLAPSSITGNSNAGR